MITETSAIPLTDAERSQLERRKLALGSWKDGQIENGELILDSVLAEEMTPRVAAACYIAKAGFRIDRGDLPGSALAIKEAAPFVDQVGVETRGSFYLQRARLHKAAGRLDEALWDYSGAAACWEQSGNREKQGAEYLNVAELYLELNDLGAARSSLAKAFAIFTEINSFYLCQAHDTEAKLLLAEDKPGAALDAITLALLLVGERETWRQQFLNTRRTVLMRLLGSLEIKTLADCDRLKVLVTEKALRESGGSLTRAGEILDVTRHAVDYIVDQNKELEPFRAKRRVRHKTLIRR